MSGTTNLTFESLTKTFGSTTALDNFSISVRAGELLTLLGPSGCGKTTALRLAAGFETPDSGRVVINGIDITSLPPHKRNIGMVFQNYSLFPHLSVLDNVRFGLRMRRVDRAEAMSRSNEMLELVRLNGLAHRYPHQLSGGQQQRVALARALTIRPDVMLLDEPLSALDAKVRAEVRDEIRALTTQFGTTTIFVTHDQDEALGLSDRLCVMNLGRVEQVGAPIEVYDKPATPFVAGFVGEMNRISLGGTEELIRPEQLRLQQGITRGLSGNLTSVSFHGPFIRYGVTLDDGQRLIAVEARAPGATLISGTRVGVTIMKASTT